MATATYPLLVLLVLPGRRRRRTRCWSGTTSRGAGHPAGGCAGVCAPADGAFEVYFPRPCEFLLARRWLVRYEARVSGSVAAGKLTALQGISVKVAFLWLGVGEVDRAGDKLSFYIGPLATSFPLGDFAESPRCRGYDDFTAAA